MSNLKRRKESGQIMILFALVMTFLMTAAVVILFNIVMLVTTATTTVDNSLRLAGISALQERDPGVGDTGGYTYWQFRQIKDAGGDGVVCTVQRLVYENLQQQASVFTTTPADATGFNAACPPVPPPASLQIETITPSQCIPSTSDCSQASDWLNGADTGTVDTCGSGGLKSSIQGGCFYKPTIVMSLTIGVKQLGNVEFPITQIVVVSAGTDKQ